MPSNLVGRWGESLAAEYLRKKRYALLAANYRCRFGEIDLIAENREHIIFVEVKLRKSARFAEALEFVDLHKQERLRKTAAVFLATHEELTKPARFDVIEVYAPQGIQTVHPDVIHLEDAFE